MSIITIGRPEKFAPVFNPIYFYVTSTNDINEGFKYVVDLYDDDSNIFITRYKIYPRPNDLFGVIDINQILASQISYTFDQTINYIDVGLEDYINYRLEVGEEYVNYWDFADNKYVLSGPYTGYLSFYGVFNNNHFFAGDIVEIIQAPGFTYSGYNGTFEVLSANSSTIIVDWPHTVNTPVNLGQAVYATHKKTLFPNLRTYSGYTAWNGAIMHQDLMSLQSSQLNLNTGATAPFLSSIPQNDYVVKPSNNMWLNFWSSAQTANSRFAYVTTHYGEYSMVNGLTGYTGSSVQILPIGPQNISDIENTYGPLPGQTYWSNDVGTYPVFKNECWESFGYIYNSTGSTFLFNSSISPWYNNGIDQIVDFYLGNQLYTTVITSTPIGQIVQIPIAPSIFIAAGFLPAVTYSSFITLFQKTEYYTVQMFGSGNTATSRQYSFDVDWNTTRYGNIELLFMDRGGSFIPANFELQSAKSVNIERNEYQTILGGLNTTLDTWRYDSTDRGRNVLNTTVKKQVELLSNWITEDTSKYWEQLFTSPVVYIKEFGEFWPVIIKDTNYKLVTKNNKKNIQVKIVVEYSNLDVVQRF